MGRLNHVFHVLETKQLSHGHDTTITQHARWYLQIDIKIISLLRVDVEVDVCYMLIIINLITVKCVVHETYIS